MTKRLAIFFGVVLAIVLAGLAWRASGPQEPVFEGRPLSRWLERHVPSSAADPPYNSPGFKKADQALLSIGTNALPTLLKMIAARDKPAVVIKLIDAARRHRWTRMQYRYASARNEEAEYAFQVLGTNAVEAVPGLIRIYERNVSPSSQRCAALALGHIGSGAQAALPVLIRNLTHTNAEVRFNAVTAIIHIRGDPSVVLPPLTAALKDSDINVRWNALSGLSYYGSRARSSASEVQKLLADQGAVGSSAIREQVETTLWRIAPEKVGKPFVVEEATPMIANGVTTKALKLVLFGERKTLIPAGKPVPAVAQYWNSDPRPSLTLYLGGSGPDETDQCLGQFEVMDLPASDSLNISTLCIIADGRLILSARDNTRHTFLGIRRVAPPAGE